MSRILDIGIGYGFYDIILKTTLGLDVSGMELEENVPVYCKLPQHYDIPIITGALSKEPCSIADDTFDVVIFSEVIEHLRVSPFRALREIHRILKPGGTLLMTTPNIARITNVIRLLLGSNVIESFPDDDSELDNITDSMTHIREYTMRELAGLTKRAGFSISKARYSLCMDRIPPRMRLSFRSKALRNLFLPIVATIPRWRTILSIQASKLAE